MKPKDEPFFVSREHPTSFGLVKEPKQVPVAWVSKRDLFQMTHAKVPNVVVCEKDRVHTEPLYTSPPQRQPLTDEEIANCYETTGHYQTLRPQDRFAVFALARAIETKLKEKNT